MGGFARQHAARCAPLDPRACRGDRAVDLGGLVARPGLGAAVLRLRDPGTRPRGVLAREAAGRTRRPACRGGPGGSRTRSPSRRANDVRRSGESARRNPKSAAVCRTDRHDPDSMGGRATTEIWTVPRPEVDPTDARLELARRYLHVFGPTTADAFAQWSGIGSRGGVAAFDALRRRLTPVRTPVGESWILTSDEPAFRAVPGPAASARLLPSGDAYFLLQGRDRELLVPDASRRSVLWTSRVWPGGVLVDGEIAGTWRRAARTVTIQTWRRLSRAARDAVEAEAASLPLPDMRGRGRVRRDDGPRAEGRRDGSVSKASMTRRPAGAPTPNPRSAVILTAATTGASSAT